MATPRKVPGIDSRKTKPKQVQTTETLLARTVEEGECLLWQGYIGMNVPQVSHGGKVVPVRRLLLELAGKNPMPGGYASTSCGNQSCVNPEHITNRNRHQHAVAMTQAPRNELLRRAKLAEFKRVTVAKITLDEAREIRSSDEVNWVLADRYGIDKSQVARIKNGTAWREFHQSPFAGLGSRA